MADTIITKIIDFSIIGLIIIFGAGFILSILGDFLGLSGDLTIALLGSLDSTGLAIFGAFLCFGIAIILGLINDVHLDRTIDRDLRPISREIQLTQRGFQARRIREFTGGRPASSFFRGDNRPIRFSSANNRTREQRIEDVREWF